jgi:hypothetical protein
MCKWFMIAYKLILASVEVMILGLENGFDNHGIVVSFKI